MSEVIGPINLDDWRLLSMLAGAKTWMQENNNNGRFDRCISMDRKIFEKTIKKYLTRH